MSVFFFIIHPARVHLYKHTIEKLENNGISTHVFVRDEESVCELLDAYGIPYEILSDQHETLVELLTEQSKFEIRSLLRAITRRPDLVIGGFGSPMFAKLLGAKAVDFFDTDHISRMNDLQAKFLDRIYTPECYKLDHGSKQIRYPGYHELAYLHPERFSPDPSVLEKVGLTQNDRFVILRLVAWNALHDVGDSGMRDVQDVIAEIESFGLEVFISAESEVPPSIKQYELRIEPHLIHHLMYHADLFIGESATMATESAVLGTPAVFISSSRRGYTDELEERYGLVFNFSDDHRQKKGLKKSISILEEYDPSVYQQRRDQMLEDKLDTTAYMYDEITDILGKKQS